MSVEMAAIPRRQLLAFETIFTGGQEIKCHALSTVLRVQIGMLPYFMNVCCASSSDVYC